MFSNSQIFDKESLSLDEQDYRLGLIQCRESTYHINPSPGVWILPTVPPPENDQPHNTCNSSHTTGYDTQDLFSQSPPPCSWLILLKPPQTFPIHAATQHTEEKRVGRKRHIIASDRRFWACGIASRILRADQRRGEERSGRYQVSGEADDIRRRKRRCGAGRSAATEVEKRLRVKGEGPGSGA